MHRTFRALSVIGLIAAGAATAATAAAPPAVTALRTPRPILLDGVLNDAAWQAAPRLANFAVFGQPGATTADTALRLAHDDKWLYLGLECGNREPGFGDGAARVRDGDVARDDAIEVFLSDAPDRGRYLHFMLNCANTKAEQRVSGTGAAAQRERAWTPTWLSAVSNAEHGWTAELALPLHLVARDGKVGPLRFNIARTKVVPDRDANAVRLGERRVLSTLFPVRESFHDPDAFAALKGLDTAAVQMPGPDAPKVREGTEPCLLALDGAAVQPYAVRDGRTVYEVLVKASYGGTAYNWADITVADRTAGGKRRETTEKVCVTAARQASVLVSLPVDEIEPRTVTVLLKDYWTKGIVDQLVLENPAVLTPLEAGFGRNYYTAEPAADLVCTVALPAEARRGLALVLQDGRSGVLARAASVAAAQRLAVPLAGLNPGTHRLALELRNAEGRPLFRKPLTLVTRRPRPAGEWKVDLHDGVLLRDGTPFFPFGVLFHQFSEDRLAAVRDLGCNMFFKWDASFPSNVFERASDAGLYVMDRLESYTHPRNIPNLSAFLAGDALRQADEPYNATRLQSTLNYGRTGFKDLTRAQRNAIFEAFYREELPDLLAGIRAASRHPALMGYNTFDEPGFAGFDMFVQGRDLYRQTNEADGYHPTLLLYSSHIPPGPEATDWGDILCTDPYWIPDGTTYKDRSSINFVSKIVRLTRQRADAARKLTWIVPLGSYWSASHRRLISPAEQLCQSYLCLIHGARGLTYYKLPEHKLLRDAIRTFGQHLARLTPALLAPGVPQETAYAPVAFDPDKDLFPDVQVALFREPAGTPILLAANTADRPALADFALSCLPDTGTVARLFAEGALAVAGGVFADRLEPFGVRAYTLPAAGAADAPVRIRVVSRPDPNAPPPAPRLPTVDYFGRRGVKNAAPNPSFEEVTIPDLPDYVIPNCVVGFAETGMRVVDTDPYHGKVCLQLTHRKGDTLLNYAGFHIACAPQHPRPKTYTWSLYMKGSRDGQQVLIGSHEMKAWNGTEWVKSWKTVALTREWQRYAVTGPVPANVPRECGLEFQFRDVGTIWVDALQFERGDAPTAFEP